MAMKIWPDKYKSLLSENENNEKSVAPAANHKIKDVKVIVIIDDAICSSQREINKLFVYGRVYNISIDLSLSSILCY